MVSSAKRAILERCESIFKKYWNWSDEGNINPLKKSTKAVRSQRKRPLEYDRIE